MKNRTVSEGTLFFSMTLEFLETYLPRQLGRSPETIKSHRNSLTIFRRYLLEKRKYPSDISIFATVPSD